MFAGYMHIYHIRNFIFHRLNVFFNVTKLKIKIYDLFSFLEIILNLFIKMVYLYLQYNYIPTTYSK